MISSRREEIAGRMQSLRRSGAKVADQLPGDMKRVKDWREYVRAMPLPSIVAAASLGFGVVLARSTHSKHSSSLTAPGTGAPGVMSAVPARSRADESNTMKKGVIRTLLQTAGSWAAAYAVSQATQLAKQVAAQQLQSLKSGFAVDVHRGKTQRDHVTTTSEPEHGAAYKPFASRPTGL